MARRRFNPDWFGKYSNWLEYIIKEDKAYCLCCYLFRPQTLSKQGGGDSFVGNGFNNWKKREKLDAHVSLHTSSHNQARKKCEDLMNLNLTVRISTLFSGKVSKDRVEYRNAAVDCVRVLLKQGLSFWGHDESKTSNNRGNYVEIFHWLAAHNDGIYNASFKIAPQNLQLVTSEIQKDICIAAAKEINSLITKDIGDAHITVLVDESRDASLKEKMAMILRYVNRKGSIIECFLAFYM